MRRVFQGRTGMALASACALGLVIAVPLAAVPSEASTRVGEIPQGEPGTNGNYEVFGPRFPTGGVVTSWEVLGSENSGDANSRASLRIWQRPDDTLPVKATVVAESKPADIRPGLNKFQTRVPVQGGDLLGISTYYLAAAGPSSSSSTCGTDSWLEPLGTVATFTCEGGYQANVAATLEPDADADGFGDETQDRCDGVKGPDFGCAAVVYSARTSAGTFKLTQKSGKLTRLNYKLTARCSGARKIQFSGSALSRSDTQAVSGDGRFTLRVDVADYYDISSGLLTIVGRLGPSGATGTVKLRARVRGRLCRITPTAWAAP